MPIIAYVLVETTPGKAKFVAEEASKIEGVKTAHAVMGRFDVILLVESEDTKSLSDLVLSKIHAIDGVLKTQTAVVFMSK
ncbi:MAG: Lrp/AsnC ligand binding domain-containing protein [Halobacteria archaeon]